MCAVNKEYEMRFIMSKFRRCLGTNVDNSQEHPFGDGRPGTDKVDHEMVGCGNRVSGAKWR